MKRSHILVLDDNERIRLGLKRRLEAAEYEVTAVDSVSDAIEAIDKATFDGALIDLTVDFDSEFGGIKVLNRLKERQPKAFGIIISAKDPGAIDEARAQHGLLFQPDGWVHKGMTGNYVLEVLRQVQAFLEKPRQFYCFVIMPFGNSVSCTAEEWDEIYNNTIVDGISRCGESVSTARSELVTGKIMDDVYSRLKSADVVVADITDNNPNVLYELGYRSALNRRFILISQNIDSIPFDLRAYGVIKYDWRTTTGRQRFAQTISGQLKKTFASDE